MNWQRIAGVLAGMAIGLGIFTFTYAKGGSYMTNDPAACANCHIMQSQYSGWMKASHRRAAVCNDCHAPHDVVGQGDQWVFPFLGIYHGVVPGKYSD